MRCIRCNGPIPVKLQGFLRAANARQHCPKCARIVKLEEAGQQTLSFDAPHDNGPGDASDRER